MFEHPGEDSSSGETCAARCSRLTHLGHVTRRRSTQQSHNFVQPVLNLSSFLRGRWLWWCMCLESKYLIGFKSKYPVLVCVCVYVWDERRRGDGSLLLSRGGTSRSVSKLGNFYVYNLHVFTIYNVYNISTPRPAQRCSVGAPSRPWLHRPAVAVCMGTSWQAFNIPRSSFYTFSTLSKKNKLCLKYIDGFP